jgi:DNA polymerase I-like protein with 3'-5' exonuclease and polymerase domains
MGALSLARKAGISPYQASEILARLRSRFSRFAEFAERVKDHAGLKSTLTTQFGWTMFCPPGCNPRTLVNFPIQSTGAEILHALCLLAERRGVEIVAPVHDAVLVECAASEAEEAARETDRAMRESSAWLLGGYELPSDCRVIRPGEHFADERGAAMWSTIEKLLARRAKGAA